MIYRGYTIRPVQHQGCRNYRVISPTGLWPEVFVDIATAKRLVDMTLREIRNLQEK